MHLTTPSLVIALLIAMPGIAQSGQVQSIEISSSWVGLGPHGGGHLRVWRDGLVYKTSEGAQLPSDRVQEFADALTASPMVEPELENLGMTEDWLRQNARKAIGDQFNGNRSGEAVPAELDLCVSTFQSPKLIRPYMLSQFKQFHTDDFPSVEIEVKTTSGKIHVSSNSQHEFMLPWEVKKAGRTSKTFDARISQALYKLLPEKFVNRQRLNADHLAERLAMDLVLDLEPQLNKLRVEGSSKWILDEYRIEYEVVDTGILTDPFRGESFTFPGFATEWGKYNTSHPYIQCKLKRTEFPPALSVQVIFPYLGATKIQVEKSRADLKAYEASVLGTPWLALYLRKHPTETVSLWYVNDKSFSDLAMREFSKDMKSIGRVALIEEVAAVQHQVVLLRVRGNQSASYSLVMPDRRVILWRSDHPKEPYWMPSGSGASMEGFSRGRLGDVISPAGELQER